MDPWVTRSLAHHRSSKGVGEPPFSTSYLCCYYVGCPAHV